MLHAILVSFLIALRSGRLNSWSLRGIKQSKLDRCSICVDCHLSAKRVDLTHHVTFGLATNCGVTTHLSDRIKVASQHQRVCTKPRRG